MDNHRHVKPAKKRKNRILVTAAVLVCAVAASVIHTRVLEVTRYTLNSANIGRPVTVLLIADHHGTPFGNNQQRLLRHIDNAAPDLILLGGDMFCHIDTAECRTETHTLISHAVSLAPTYFVSGNHEAANPEYWTILKEVSDLGAVILYDEFDIIELKGNRILIAGGNNPSALRSRYFHDIRNATADYRIMLTHFPENADSYARFGFDVIMAGHAHGGQIRIPLIAPNGLYTPGQGLFPEHTGGKYQLDDGTHLVVSRGLSLKRSARFRLFNRPELVVITLE
jgi:hypothetical protein